MTASAPAPPDPAAADAEAADGDPEAAARQAAEAAARDCYGRLLSLLAARTRDVAAAEDALADAFHAALRTWPAGGVPANPAGWLFTAARRGLAHAARSRSSRNRAAPALAHLADEVAAGAALPGETAVVADRRLALLFVCAHPSIDPAMHAPLMLQTVLGLDAARIASAFLVAPATLGQRLVRAKAKIRDAGIGFAVPEADALPGRLDSVLQAIYAAYGSGWEDVAGADPRRRGLTGEALFLGRLLAEHLPEAAEAHGLLALMLHCEARRPARRDAEGRFVALADQDPALWSTPLIREAEAHLLEAQRRAGADPVRFGRFQLEAAIQSAHASRAATGTTPWPAIAALYDALLAVAPTVGAAVGRAAAIAEARGPAAGLETLALIESDAVATYQPYWALRAHLLTRSGAPAAAAWDRAIGLAEDPAVRAFLSARAGRG